MIYNTDCTVFNRLVHPPTGEEFFIPTLLCGVFWQGESADRMTDTNPREADSTTVFIPFRVKCDKLWVFPGDYLNDPTNKWTLRVGDILLKGRAADFAPTCASAAEIHAQAREAMTVTYLAAHDFGSASLRHWEVREDAYYRRN